MQFYTNTTQCLQNACHNGVEGFKTRFPNAYGQISKTASEVSVIRNPIVYCLIGGLFISLTGNLITLSAKPVSGFIAGVWINQRKAQLVDGSPLTKAAWAVSALALAYFQPLFAASLVVGYFFSNQFSGLISHAANAMKTLGTELMKAGQKPSPAQAPKQNPPARISTPSAEPQN